MKGIEINEETKEVGGGCFRLRMWHACRYWGAVSFAVLSRVTQASARYL
jgi:hypothetical protein